jgi:hypothetical protein
MRQHATGGEREVHPKGDVSDHPTVPQVEEAGPEPKPVYIERESSRPLPPEPGRQRDGELRERALSGAVMAKDNGQRPHCEIENTTERLVVRGTKSADGWRAWHRALLASG